MNLREHERTSANHSELLLTDGLVWLSAVLFSDVAQGSSRFCPGFSEVRSGSLSFGKARQVSPRLAKVSRVRLGCVRKDHQGSRFMTVSLRFAKIHEVLQVSRIFAKLAKIL